MGLSIAEAGRAVGNKIGQSFRSKEPGLPHDIVVPAYRADDVEANIVANHLRGHSAYTPVDLVERSRDGGVVVFSLEPIPTHGATVNTPPNVSTFTEMLMPVTAKSQHQAIHKAEHHT